MDEDLAVMYVRLLELEETDLGFGTPSFSAEVAKARTDFASVRQRLRDLLDNDPSAAFDVIARISDTATKATVLATLAAQLSLFLEEHGPRVVALASEKRRTHRGFELLYDAAVAGSFG
jgi:hypothetical protein